jgi:hypothetical protein
MTLQYGEAFLRMGVPNMGRIGAPWCGLAPDGVMVFMAHQNYFRREDGVYFYVDETVSALPPASSALETDRRMSRYYNAGNRAIRLVVGRFVTDGDPLRSSVFHSAPGFYFDAELEWIRPGGLQRAKVIARREIPMPGMLEVNGIGERV